MVIFYTILCIVFSLKVNADADNTSQANTPQILTERKIVRSAAAAHANPKVRIKDIARFSGIRDNQLVGYGLVVGLNGTGDTLSSSPYTKESLIGMLERLGVNIRDNSLPSGRNVAAVMVTAKLPPFARAGTTIDIVVSALGDAKDLNGGTLLVTPLMGADGEVYAVGQGEVIVSGMAAQGVAASQVTGIPTTAKIPNGAIVEKEITFQLTDLKSQTLSLRSPDLTTAKRVTEAINAHFRRTVASAQDSASIGIELPKGLAKIIEAMTQIEQLEIEPDQVAKVIIDPSGVIVLGNKVRISPVALTHGSVKVRIAESASVSQPNPFTQVVNPLDPGAPIGLGLALQGAAQSAVPSGRQATPAQAAQSPQVNAPNLRQNFLSQTPSMLNATLNPNTPLQQATIIPETTLKVEEEKGKFAILDSGVDLEELVNALNLLGTSPREMAQILQSIKAAGALHAEVIVS